MVPAQNRFAYLPRTPPFIVAKSYSGRMPLTVFRLAFFIESSLGARRAPGSDDPDQVVFLGVRNHQNAIAAGNPDGEVPWLKVGMIDVRKSS